MQRKVNWCYKATDSLNKEAVAEFLNKVEAYINQNTPANPSLIANIKDIRAARIESFWQEPEIPFPNPDQKFGGKYGCIENQVITRITH
jgi:hypothetical protein